MLKRQTEATLALIHAQATQFVHVNKDGTARVMNINNCVPVVPALGLGVFAAAEFQLTSPLSTGLEVRGAYDFAGPDKGGGCSPWAPLVAPELIRLSVAPDLRREADFEPKRPPEAAKELHCKETALVAPKNTDMGLAEFKKMVPWENIAGKANRANVADPLTCLNLIAASRGAPAYAHLSAAAVPFEVMRQ